MRGANLFVLGLLVTACGGSEPSAQTPPTATSQPVAVTPTAAAPTPTTTATAKKDDAPAGEPGPAPTGTNEEIAMPVDAPPPASDADKQNDTKAANAFALKMMLRASKKDRGNLMVSGTSLRQAFGAAYVGANGATKTEMATTFGFPDDAKKAASAARAEIDAWQKAKGQGAELSVANKIWVEKSMPVNAKYGALVAWAFGAPAANLDFKGAADESRRTINTWVAAETKDKIKELLPEGAVTGATRAVITNAIYFKGKWVNPFPKDGTRDEPFKVDVAAKKTVNVPTMHVIEQFRYAHVDNVQVVEMRYVGNDLSLIVVLPDDASPAALAKLEEKLGADTLDKWNAALQGARLELAMPKFTFKWGGSMKSALTDLGVKTAFTEKADLSGIAMKPGDLYVSDVFHQTWVALDEQGTEAAAATGMIVKLTSMATGQPTKVTVDHPFLFFVRGRGRILFAGRVVEPKP
jgi:serpin B